MGVYKVQGRNHDGQPIYKHESSNEYIFFFNKDRWLLGAQIGVDDCGVFFNTPNFCVTKEYSEYPAYFWDSQKFSSKMIQITCSTERKTSPTMTIAEFMEKVDKDHNGYVSVEELKDAFGISIDDAKAVFESSDLKKNSNYEVKSRDLAHYFDRNGDGLLDVEDITTALFVHSKSKSVASKFLQSKNKAVLSDARNSRITKEDLVVQKNSLKRVKSDSALISAPLTRSGSNIGKTSNAKNKDLPKVRPVEAVKPIQNVPKVQPIEGGKPIQKNPGNAPAPAKIQRANSIQISASSINTEKLSVSAIFNCFDEDRSGFIDQREIYLLFCKSQKDKCDPKAVPPFLGMNYKVSLNTFVIILNKQKENDLVVKSEFAKVFNKAIADYIFQNCPKNSNSGTISRPQTQKISPPKKLSVSENSIPVKEIFDFLDTDKSGSIDTDELVFLFCRTFSFKEFCGVAKENAKKSLDSPNFQITRKTFTSMLDKTSDSDPVTETELSNFFNEHVAAYLFKKIRPRPEQYITKLPFNALIFFKFLDDDQNNKIEMDEISIGSLKAKGLSLEISLKINRKLEKEIKNGLTLAQLTRSLGKTNSEDPITESSLASWMGGTLANAKAFQKVATTQALLNDVITKEAIRYYSNINIEDITIYLDKDGDGTIDLEEIQNMLSLSVDEAKKVFDYFTKDASSKTLSLEIFKTKLKSSIRTTITGPEFARIFYNGDEKKARQAAAKIYRFAIEIKKYVPSTIFLNEVLEYLDQDKSGKISSANLESKKITAQARKAIQNIVQKHKKIEISALKSILDTDGTQIANARKVKELFATKDEYEARKLIREVAISTARKRMDQRQFKLKSVHEIENLIGYY
eukprot:c21864_g1_i1.p1 GENE.c21864_g1_i1~~c21864_g1_i1.p1  ORF type:complete len:859 (+),score=274.89 c21864_g1_i1:103-2679(+)